MKEITIREIARQANVSVGLVSQVLNNRDARVSDATRKKILDIAQRNYYVPNKLASALKSKKTNIIAIVCPFTPEGFFSKVIYYIEQFAMERGYNAIVMNTFNDPKKEIQALELYKSGLFDGMLISALASTPEQNVYAGMKESGFPFVFVDRFAEGVEAPVVSSNHYSVAYDMTKKMIESGKKDILFLNRVGQAENSTSKSRREGYSNAMRDCGLTPFEKSFTLLGGEHDGQADLSQVLSSLDYKPDAFFLYSGFYMPHLIKAFGESRFMDTKAEFMTVDEFAFTQELLIHKDLVDRVVGHFLIAVQDIKNIARSAVDILVGIIEKELNMDVRILNLEANIFWS